jgi:hypothetical protein
MSMLERINPGVQLSNGHSITITAASATSGVVLDVRVSVDAGEIPADDLFPAQQEAVSLKHRGEGQRVRHDAPSWTKSAKNE